MIVINHTAVLRPPTALPQGISGSRCWYITFGLGKAAGGTFTRVEFARSIEQPEHVLDTVVRKVAEDLYGTAWAFHYRPNQYAEAIGRWDLRIREHIHVTELEVWES